MVEHSRGHALVPGPDRAAGAGRVPLHASCRPSGRCAMPVQDVYKFDQRRIIAGRVESGTLRVGDEVVFSPSNKTAKIKTIEAWHVPEAPEIGPGRAERSASPSTEQIFVERGEVMSHLEQAPIESNVFKARLFWLGHKPLLVGNSYTLKLGTLEAPVTVEAIEHVIDTSDLSTKGAERIERNGAGEVVLRTKRMLALDEHRAEPDHRPVRPGRGLPADGRRDHLDGGLSRPAPADHGPLDQHHRGRPRASPARRARRATATRAPCSGSPACPVPASRPWRWRSSASCSPRATRSTCWTATISAPASTPIWASARRTGPRTSAASARWRRCSPMPASSSSARSSRPTAPIASGRGPRPRTRSTRSTSRPRSTPARSATRRASTSAPARARSRTSPGSAAPTRRRSTPICVVPTDELPIDECLAVLIRYVEGRFQA